MQALQIERQTDQAPLTSGCLLAAQRELTEAHHLFDDADDWLDRAFAQAIDRLSNRSFELVGHLHLGTGISRWRLRLDRKALPPTRMVWITSSRDKGVDLAALEQRNIRFTKVARVQCGGLWGAQLGRDAVQGRLDFLLIGRVVRETLAHNQQALLIDGDLRVIVLLEALGAAVFHDPRFGIGEVVLVLVTRTRCGRLGRAPARRPSGLTFFLGAFLYPGVVLSLLQRGSFFGPRFQHRFGFGQACQARLPDSDFIAHHQSIWHLVLIYALTQGEQFLDFGTQVRFQGQLVLVADRL